MLILTNLGVKHFPAAGTELHYIVKLLRRSRTHSTANEHTEYNGCDHWEGNLLQVNINILLKHLQGFKCFKSVIIEYMAFMVQ